jgi:hypothetical protein
MASGIALPFGTVNGRLALITGEEQLQKIILLSLSDCDSANPFQDLGIGMRAIFAIDGPEVRSHLSEEIKKAFTRFEKAGKARLSPGYPKFDMNSTTQELVAHVRYINMETATTSELDIVYSAMLA